MNQDQYQWLVVLLKSERDAHVSACKNRLAFAATLAGSDHIAPIQAAIDADKHAFAAGVIDRILAASGIK